MTAIGGFVALMGAVLGGVFYLYRMRHRVVDSLVVNMVDVGEETGELDTMLYKVADQYDEEVKTLTDGLTDGLPRQRRCSLPIRFGFTRPRLATV